MRLNRDSLQHMLMLKKMKEHDFLIFRPRFSSEFDGMYVRSADLLFFFRRHIVVSGYIAQRVEILPFHVCPYFHHGALQLQENYGRAFGKGEDRTGIVLAF